ncbi:PREDICTED: 28S ribosomal protein S15, mitochondrial isoform X1 [Miniopterus natalensis]|uniref:28S ribosomal protein S15, mitochondrial isoform X1 n=1 Tax=Miniopterus natalensis TaxID=291302 RepID=UPI0007A6E5EC|nr:PREDICTED: 28S ribosomal protein S15, mitochondrial isoform X1 [Miniopterus natalensis]
MLRAAWRVLSSIRTQAPVLGLSRGGCARLPSDHWGLPSPPGGFILPATRGYATQKPEGATQAYPVYSASCLPCGGGSGFPFQSSLHIGKDLLLVRPSQEDDLPPSTLLKDYQNIPGIEKVDDVVKRILSLEMANRKEKLKIKQEQLMNKVVANPEDTSSLEARIVALTVKIRNYEEHMQKHRKDKAHKRYLLMSIDQRKKMLKNLRKTNYNVFEKTCKDLGIEYTFPPLYHRKAHRRWVTKKALCIRVYQEVQKLKKQKRALKAAAAAARKQGQMNPESSSKAGPEEIKENQ